MISSLQLQHFMAFTDLSVDFSPGINIIIGENGTGKTQLLKAILALSGPETSGDEADKQLARKMCRLYHPLSDQVGELRRTGERGKAVLRATFASGHGVAAQFSGNATVVKVSSNTRGEAVPAVFVPTKEVLSLVRGLTADNPHKPTIERIFDDGYLDLANALKKGDARNFNITSQNNPRLSSIIPSLVNIIGGRYLLKAGRFCFQPGNYVNEQGESTADEELAPQSFKDSELRFLPKRVPLMSSGMTAEGFRKIGVLQRLLVNGTLDPGTTGPLLWDEPESNLNPKLMKDLVSALLELARNGQQIILATHDYVLLKWFDLLMDKGKGDQARFFSLYRDGSTGDVRASMTDDYLHIAPNPIDEAFGLLINKEIENDMRGLGK